MFRMRRAKSTHRTDAHLTGMSINLQACVGKIREMQRRTRAMYFILIGCVNAFPGVLSLGVKKRCKACDHIQFSDVGDGQSVIKQCHSLLISQPTRQGKVLVLHCSTHTTMSKVQTYSALFKQTWNSIHRYSKQQDHVFYRKPVKILLTLSPLQKCSMNDAKQWRPISPTDMAQRPKLWINQPFMFYICI